MAIKGYKKPLEDKDLWSLNKRDTSKVAVMKLLQEWEKELAKAKRYVCTRRGRGGSVVLSKKYSPSPVFSGRSVLII